MRGGWAAAHTLGKQQLPFAAWVRGGTVSPAVPNSSPLPCLSPCRRLATCMPYGNQAKVGAWALAAAGSLIAVQPTIDSLK